MYPTTVQLLLGGHLLNGHPYKAASNQSLDESFSIVLTSFKRSSFLSGRYPFLRVWLFNWGLNCILRYYVTGLIWPNRRSGVFLSGEEGKRKKKRTPDTFTYQFACRPLVAYLSTASDVILCFFINVSQSQEINVAGLKHKSDKAQCTFLLSRQKEQQATGGTSFR